MKRYAITEISEEVADAAPANFKVWINKSDILTGPVELMQMATKVAGVVGRLPKKGDTYFSIEDKVWRQAKIDFGGMAGDYPKACIPTPEPEPEKPCPNCQGIEHGKFVEAYVTMFFKEPKCMKCGKFQSEWTYKNAPSHDNGGIGGGGTGGPI